MADGSLEEVAEVAQAQDEAWAFGLAPARSTRHKPPRKTMARAANTRIVCPQCGKDCHYKGLGAHLARAYGHTRAAADLLPPGSTRCPNCSKQLGSWAAAIARLERTSCAVILGADRADA